MSVWHRTTKFDPVACALADRHYSRRKVGAPQFMPPGQTVVLLSECTRAVFGWWRPHPSSGIRQMNGRDGWTCTIFRNESRYLSSFLISEAECELLSLYDCGPDGLLTYVWDIKVQSTNPGFCFQAAGWRRVGRSADRRKTLLQKVPPSAAPCIPQVGGHLTRRRPSRVAAGIFHSSKGVMRHA